jgi:hypothetical protein
VDWPTGALVLMRDWLTDEERARDEKNAWKLRVEAWALGLAMLATLIAAITGWL